MSTKPRVRLLPASACGPRTSALLLVANLALTSAPLAAQGNDGPGELVPLSSQADGWTQMWTLELSRGGSAPLVWSDSLLLVASLDRNVHLVSVDGEPRIEWKANFKGGFESAPLIDGDRIYLGEMFRGNRLVALDRRTMDVLWTARSGDLVARPVLTEDRIFTVSSVGLVIARDLQGVEMWRTDLETRVVANPIVLEGSLLVVASHGKLYALDPRAGGIKATREPDSGPIWGDPLIRRGVPSTAIYATLEGQVIEVDESLEIVQQRSFPSRFYEGPSADGDHLFLAGHEGTIWGYDWVETRILWRSELPGSVRTVPAFGQGFVAVADLAGNLYVLDRSTGSINWQTRLDDAVTSPPFTRGDELYVLTERGTLYQFRAPAGSGM